MPVGGAAGEISWRLSWIVVPVLFAVVGTAALARRDSTPPAPVRAGLRTVLSQPGVVRWSLGELLAYSAWLGVLLFVGALFVESHGLSIGATGLVLGLGTLLYIPGNLFFRRWVDVHGRGVLISLGIACGVTAIALYSLRPNLWVSIALFGLAAFLAGGRTLAGGTRALDLAPELRLGVTGVRTAAIQSGSFVGAAVGGAALAAGGFTAAGFAFGALFAAGAVPHLLPSTLSA
jgi:predicted MFS family arabinose efflux permease